jgi:hypothetical protein
MVRWWWFGPSVARDELSRELTAIAAAGLGGVEVAYVYPLGPATVRRHDSAYQVRRAGCDVRLLGAAAMPGLGTTAHRPAKPTDQDSVLAPTAVINDYRAVPESSQTEHPA